MRISKAIRCNFIRSIATTSTVCELLAETTTAAVRATREYRCDVKIDLSRIEAISRREYPKLPTELIYLLARNKFVATIRFTLRSKWFEITVKKFKTILLK